MWLLATFLITHAGSQLVRPMVSYRGLQLGISPADLGWLAASFSLAPLLMALSIGRLVDRYGELRFVLAGNVLLLGAAFGLAFAPSVPVLLALFAAMGLGHLTMVVAIQGLVARGGEERTYDRRFAHLALSASAGQLIGPAVGGIVAGSGSVDEVSLALLVGGALCTAGVPCVAFIRPPASVAAGRAAPSASGGGSLLAILRMPGILRAILVSTTVLSAIDVIVAYLPALGEERGWAPAFVGGLLAVRAGASMASRIFLGAWSDRFGRRALLAGSMAVAAISLGLMPLVVWEAPVVVLMAVGGFGLGIGQPVTMSWVAALASPGTRATALSVRLMGNRVGQMAVPVVAGLVAGSAGAGWILGFTGLVVAGSLALVYGGLAASRSTAPAPAASDSTTVRTE
jgi:MFS family permease